MTQEKHGIKTVQFRPKEQETPLTERSVIAGLRVFRVGLQSIAEGAAQANAFSSAYSSVYATVRRELIQNATAFNSQSSRVVSNADRLVDRIKQIEESDFVYLQVREKMHDGKKQRTFLITTENPYDIDKVGKHVEGVNINLLYDKSGKPTEVRIVPREVVASMSGAFAWIERETQDEGFTISQRQLVKGQERYIDGQDGFVEGYVDVTNGQMALSKSPAFSTLLSGASEKTKTQLKQAVNPAVNERDMLTLFLSLDGISTQLLTQQQQ